MSASRSLVRVLSVGLAIVLLLVLAAAAYSAFGPGPLDFARQGTASVSKDAGRDPTGVPPSLASASLVERGRYLARAADCISCHTEQDGTPFTGGRAFVLPFGTLYSTNITPDLETGIGKYTDRDFLNAVRKGIGRDSKHVYPAMPYTSYAYMSDADALAIKTYLFSLKPLHAVTPRASLSFPFSQRPLMAIWNAFFSPDHRYQPNTERSAEWNRGAYLAEAMGHCGECHTPRNFFMSLNNRRKFGGELQAGWRAYNISSDPLTGVGAWSEGELADYLSHGHTPRRGAATGPMEEAVDLSLAYLDRADVAAIASYLKSVPPVQAKDLPVVRATPPPGSGPQGATGNTDIRGETVYAEACAGCHGWNGVSAVLPLASLIGVRSVNDPSGINVAQVIVHGASPHPGETTSSMPAFGDTFSDSDVASLANYVTARFGAFGARLSAADVARLRALD